MSLMKNEQQSQNLLLKVDPRSTFRNNFLQPATNVFVARHKVKNGNIDQNLQRNNVARQVEGFCISYFAALTLRRNNGRERPQPVILAFHLKGIPEET